MNIQTKYDLGQNFLVNNGKNIAKITSIGIVINKQRSKCVNYGLATFENKKTQKKMQKENNIYIKNMLLLDLYISLNEKQLDKLVRLGKITSNNAPFV